MSQATRLQISRFLLVGSTTVIIDFLVYVISFSLMGLSKSPAKTLGFLVGTTFAYYANKLWTFDGHESKKGGVLLFLFLYGGTLIVNVAINALLLYLTTNFPGTVLLSFVVATLTSAFLNFLGMKSFVFANSKESFHQLTGERQ